MEKITQMTEQYAQKATKIAKSYQTMAGINEIDLATAPKDLVWNDGKISLFRYKNNAKTTIKVPLLIVYALVNKQDMMDLQPDKSVVRKMLALGLDVYIMDWGTITRADRYTTMNDYINGYINGAVEYMKKAHNLPKINLLGVCQGGTFSTIYAAMHPENIKNLVVMVAPIDFSNRDGLLFRWAIDMDVDALVDNGGGIVSGELLNSGFDMLKPLAKIRKYTAIVDSLDDKEKMLNFLRMEKWVANSPDQAGECFRQFIKDMYQGNKLIKGELVLGGEKVSLKNINMPVLNIYAESDHLVPPPCSTPLTEFISSKDTKLYKFAGGHIGVFVGSRSQNELSPTIVEWLKARD